MAEWQGAECCKHPATDPGPAQLCQPWLQHCWLQACCWRVARGYKLGTTLHNAAHSLFRMWHWTVFWVQIMVIQFCLYFWMDNSSLPMMMSEEKAKRLLQSFILPKTDLCKCVFEYFQLSIYKSINENWSNMKRIPHKISYLILHYYWMHEIMHSPAQCGTRPRLAGWAVWASAVWHCDQWGLDPAWPLQSPP